MSMLHINSTHRLPSSRGSNKCTDLDPEGLDLLLQVIKGHASNAADRPSKGRVHNVLT